ncbi:MAG: ferredoxin--nitrite reductase [Pseudanabaenaceae cyanobacterium bins.68]|nr:ferredoxin--nitrite reductase [Pseudanabaenaceae cyanobacterium bins.68]
MANKIEDLKAKKDGLAVKAEIEYFAQIGWEAIDEDDLQHRLKWLGIFFRKTTPGKFMVRMRIPHGLVTSEQMLVMANVLERCGSDGVADITTRQNLQMRGIKIEDVPQMLSDFHGCGLTSVQSAMDNVRNITGSPVAGLDPDEIYDTRDLVLAVQNMITNHGEGNPEFTNLPRKFNIAIDGSRDNATHAEINDIAFVPAFQGEDFGFNILVGGFFSSRRVAAAVPLNAWAKPDQVVAICRGILEIFRDHGSRENRQKARLMYLIDDWGIEKFRQMLEDRLGYSLSAAAEQDLFTSHKQDHIGVHRQKQAGYSYVGLQIPVGRMYAHEMRELARLAQFYGSGEMRLTVEQNLIIAHVPDQNLPSLLAEPILERFPASPSFLVRGLVSCTGAQFCPVAIVETKNRSLELIQQLESDLSLTHPVRLHWSGCPNSCGQPQVADIGFIGCKARKNGKVVDGVDIYMGGKVGKDAHLGECVLEKVPCEDLREIVGNLLIQHFGAVPKKQLASV